MSAVNKTLVELDTTFWNEFVPSWTAYKASPYFYDQAGVIKQHIRDEYSVSTLGLLAWLITWAVARRKADEQ